MMTGICWKTPELIEVQEALTRAASTLVSTYRTSDCPSCGASHLRFYAHVFNKKKMLGSVWVWCPKCFIHGHGSRMPLSAELTDPFEDYDIDTFAKLEKAGWLDRLNQMWEHSELPHQYPADVD